MSWDEKFLNLALTIGQWSKDRSSKVGCVITGQQNEILATGYNGLPRGCNDQEETRHERPVKYQWFEHAERNAIYNAARVGVPLQGSTLYCGSTLLGPPCVDCARALIQAGVRRVVGRIGDNDPSQWQERWRESMLVSVQMFKETGIIFEVIKLPTPFDLLEKTFHDYLQSQGWPTTRNDLNKIVRSIESSIVSPL